MEGALVLVADARQASMPRHSVAMKRSLIVQGTLQPARESLVQCGVRQGASDQHDSVFLFPYTV
jgi:hypothetical protein